MGACVVCVAGTGCCWRGTYDKNVAMEPLKKPGMPLVL